MREFQLANKKTASVDETDATQDVPSFEARMRRSHDTDR